MDPEMASPLVSALSDENAQVTVLAPSNSAFEAIPNMDITRLLENMGALAAVRILLVLSHSPYGTDSCCYAIRLGLKST